jgi:putative membrane protein insertion efficiency factor
MSMNGTVRAAPRRAVVIGIRFYQRFISPITPPSCRFYPTCSSYALTSVERFGVLRGGWMGICRIARCNPFNPGGYDPVPETLGRHTHDHAPRHEEEESS